MNLVRVLGLVFAHRLTICYELINQLNFNPNIIEVVDINYLYPLYFIQSPYSIPILMCLSRLIRGSPNIEVL